ncbi:MAG: hypothetical protein HYY93_16070 [Planctomycetes bacterium]|nr:hypothetical protein [Planctomycetota bacterium]
MEDPFAPETPDPEGRHKFHFDKAGRALDEQYREGLGTHEILRLQARYIFEAARCASGWLSEDLRIRRYRLLCEQEKMRLSSAEASKQLVDEIRRLKESSDRRQTWLVIGTWVLAAATIALGWIEHAKL